MFSSSSKSSENCHNSQSWSGFGSNNASATNSMFSQSAPSSFSTSTTVTTNSNFSTTVTQNYSNPSSSGLRVHPADIATMLF